MVDWRMTTVSPAITWSLSNLLPFIYGYLLRRSFHKKRGLEQFGVRKRMKVKLESRLVDAVFKKWFWAVNGIRFNCTRLVETNGATSGDGVHYISFIRITRGEFELLGRDFCSSVLDASSRRLLGGRNFLIKTILTETISPRFNSCVSRPDARTNELQSF